MLAQGYLGIKLIENSVWIFSNSPDGVISNIAFYAAMFKTDGTFLWKWNNPDASMAFGDIDQDGNAYCE